MVAVLDLRNQALRRGLTMCCCMARSPSRLAACSLPATPLGIAHPYRA